MESGGKAGQPDGGRVPGERLDTGYGAGPAAFGLIAGHTGYPAVFAVTGALMLAATPASWREHPDRVSR